MNAYAVLSAEALANQVSTIARVGLSQRNPRIKCPMYFAALDASLVKEPPPFATKAYSDIYRAASADGHWLAISLITNAEREGDGATRLWSLAACCPNDEERELLKRHAVDESGHALAYLSLLDLTFPDSVEHDFRAELNQLSPHYSMKQEPVAVEGSPYAKPPSIDDFVQMNIAEIRTTIHHLMQREALAFHCPVENLSQTTRVLDSLLRDELSHVAYSAVLIERKAKTLESEEFLRLFSQRLRDFNHITNQELGQMTFD